MRSARCSHPRRHPPSGVAAATALVCRQFLYVLLAALGGKALAVAALPTIPVGVAKIDATPDYPVRLNGFGYRRTESEGVAQKLWVKALAFGDDPQSGGILLTVDNLGVPDYLTRDVARRLHDKLGLDPSRFVITFTHTHTAPMLQGASSTIFGETLPPEHQAHVDRYTQQMRIWLEEAALKAWQTRQPAVVAWNVGSVAFAVNRRKGDGPVDHDLPVLAVKDPDGNLRAIYATYACHCVTLGHNQITGDWAGFAAAHIEEAHPGSVALVSIGCGADSNPSTGVTQGDLQAASLQGRVIREEVERLLQLPMRALGGPIAARYERLELPLAEVPPRPHWEERAKSSNRHVAHHARMQLARLDRGEQLRTAISYPVQSWTFNDELAMVFLSGEVVVDYAHRLKRELDANRLWVHGYSNDFPFYIPSERILTEGGYEGGESMIYFDLPARFAPGLEQKIIDAVRRQLPAAFAAKHDATRTGGTFPLSPQRSLAAIRTRPGFTVELVAAEPLVVDPVAIDFGPDGRLWVAEMHDYPTGIDGNFRPGGRVKVLEDSDADGRYDRAAVFLDGVPFPTGVTVWRDGVLVCAAPDILFARDADGDGRADDVKKLFSGFATHNYQARVNSLQPGLDNWMYASSGLFGGQIESFTGGTVDLASRDFRFRPEPGQIEPVTGQTQQSRVRDDWDNWFGCDNSTLVRHYPVVDRYARRNPRIAPPDVAVYVPDDPESNRLYPIAPRLVTFPLSGPAGRVTAACGLGIYRDELLGPEFLGNSFTCEPVNQVVHRLILTPQGVTFAGRRAEDEQRREFLASTDSWFRPVQARSGPDGALWIVDMYRYLIEHPIWIPGEIVATIDVRAGDTRGRIYRVYRADRPPRPIARLDRLDAPGLAAALDSPNGPQRDLVQQLLVARGERDVVLPLERLARQAARPQVRAQALCVLEGLHALRPATLRPAIDDPHPGVRRQAIRLSETLANRPEALVARLAARVADDDPQVRLQLAYTLGEFADEAAAAALLQLAAGCADDPQLEAAVLSSVTSRNAAALLGRLTAGHQAAGSERLLETLLGLPEIADNAALRARVIALAAAAVEKEPGAWQFRVASQVFDRLRDAEGEAPRALARQETAQLGQIVAAARRLVADDAADAALRASAVRTLGYGADGGETADDARRLTELLSPRTPLEVQLAAVEQLARLAVDAAPAAWLARWEACSPAVRTALLDALLSRPAWSESLLKGIESGQLHAADLDAARRQRLLNSSDNATRELARKLLADPASSDRRQVVESYADVAALPGDRGRGRQVFAKSCAACHRLEETGQAVGPDLAPLAHKPPQTLLLAILDPNQAVDPRYLNYLAVTADGRQFTGLLTDETATSVTLVAQDNKRQTLLRAEIESLVSGGKSLMPEGLEREIGPPAMADLLAYLAAAAEPPKVFDGNRPQRVAADTGGNIQLTAANSEIRGPQLIYEPQFGNLGFWSSENDSATWTVELAEGGDYDVVLDYACHDDSAGNHYCLESPGGVLRGEVAGTGQWSDYHQATVGRLRLPAGANRWTMRSQGPIEGALIDLRAIRLVRVREK